MEKKVMHFMRRGAITCRENKNIREVAQIMLVNSTRSCVMTNGHHEVVGIISARSIIKALGKDLEAMRARNILLP